MVDVKFARDLAPLFPLQAVNTPKREFITKPGAIRVIFRVPIGAVASVVAWSRAVEDQVGVLYTSSVSSSRRCSSLAPSSGTVPS